MDKAEAIRKALVKVFPDWTYLLCIWHANKAISAHSKAHFNDDDDWKKFMTDWTTIIYSKSEDEYIENVEAFKENWLVTHLEDIAYIESSWLIPRNRDRLVSA